MWTTKKLGSLCHCSYQTQGKALFIVIITTWDSRTVSLCCNVISGAELHKDSSNSKEGQIAWRQVCVKHHMKSYGAWDTKHHMTPRRRDTPNMILTPGRHTKPIVDYCRPNWYTDLPFIPSLQGLRRPPPVSCVQWSGLCAESTLDPLACDILTWDFALSRLPLAHSSPLTTRTQVDTVIAV